MHESADTWPALPRCPSPPQPAIIFGEGLPEAYAALGRHQDAVTAARLVQQQFPFNPFVQLHALGVTGRSLAALANAGERCKSSEDGGAAACAVLVSAVAEARRIKVPFVELMLARDLTVVAGDKPGSPAVLRRLGEPLAKLVSGPAELDPLLGPGFDAAAALLAVQQ